MKIIKYPNPVLEEICMPVVDFDDELEALVKGMTEAMENAEVPAMAIAANQVGVTKRVMVMKEKLEDGTYSEPFELINPKIMDEAGLAHLVEGCLSAPNVFYEVTSRYENIYVEYKDKEGKDQERTFKGINAVCVQHEIDHLNGIFFFDRLNRKNRRQALRRWDKQKAKFDD